VNVSRVHSRDCRYKKQVINAYVGITSGSSIGIQEFLHTAPVDSPPRGGLWIFASHFLNFG
jgi:hypothetical protein